MRRAQVGGAMALNPFKKPKLLSEFLEICKNNEYFSAIASGTLIKNVEFLKYMTRLQSNIENQWASKSIGLEDKFKKYGPSEFDVENTKNKNLSLLDRYSMICKRDKMAKSIPFGLIDMTEVQKDDLLFGSKVIGQSDVGRNDPAKDQTSCEMNEADDAVGIDLEHGSKQLTCSYLVTDKQGQEYFYRVQRLRKIWWMKVNFSGIFKQFSQFPQFHRAF